LFCYVKESVADEKSLEPRLSRRDFINFSILLAFLDVPGAVAGDPPGQGATENIQPFAKTVEILQRAY
jgi:hypothetical protein